MSKERALFATIAEPMTNYFAERGLDKIETLPMVTELTDRIYKNITNRFELTATEAPTNNPTGSADE